MSEVNNGFGRVLAVLMRQKLVVMLLASLLLVAGIGVAPFAWQHGIPLKPVTVDAIPNLGENQQIVFADWAGRSPQDVEDQVTYPLSAALMGVPGVKDVRSLSMFGFSSIALIFDEDIEFYWARSRILEKLASLPEETLPSGVQPALGPDATGLGQVFWYTLEGQDPQGKTTGGWTLAELRSVQDWYLRSGLLTAEGISEVAAIGGYQREYQIEVDANLLRLYQVSLEQVTAAVMASNLDVSAGSREINGVEYLIRGQGFIKNLADLEQAVVRLGPNNTPIRVQDVASVNVGPAARRGALDVAGAEAVGAVVTVREGYNPRQAIAHLRQRMQELAPGMPAKAVIDWAKTSQVEVERFASAQSLPDYQLQPNAWRDWLRAQPQADWPTWLTLSQVSIVPFYDRSLLIDETVGTLESALSLQLLLTTIVVLALLWQVRAALAISLLLPATVLCTFLLMRLFQVEANIVALAGIAIAIGTIVDLGIIFTENFLRQRQDKPALSVLQAILQAGQEVGPAILTAISTTVISFLPVFAMTGAEGKLFGPLAYTKTFVLLCAVLLAVTVLPVLLYLLFAPTTQGLRTTLHGLAKRLPAPLLAWTAFLPNALLPRLKHVLVIILLITALVLLSQLWLPLGPAAGFWHNLLLVSTLLLLILGGFWLFQRAYLPLLALCLRFKALFIVLPLLVVLTGLSVWLGADRVIPGVQAESSLAKRFPGLGREFMPALDEGAFLFMPSLMPHTSISEALAVLQQQDKAIAAIPEVKSVVGKIGRADTALDPAPLGMIETLIQYHSEYRTDAQGRRQFFRFDSSSQQFARDANGELIADPRGRPYRQWREHITSPDDIWQEIVQAAQLPGVTSAPKLQPIETRLLMLQTGMRAAMGIKLQAPDLATLEQMALQFEAILRQAPGIAPLTVNAERVVGQPYLSIVPDRQAIARHGLSMQQVQQSISTALGGMEAGRTVEGRERYPIRVRYQREQRDTVEAINQVLISTPAGYQVPLSQLAELRYERGPQMIRSENSFLTAYITFGAHPGLAEVEAVAQVEAHLMQLLNEGELILPAGVSYQFAGSYQQQQSAAATLMWLVPLALILIFMLLYLQFQQVSTALMIFSSIAIAWAGGFIALDAFAQPDFLNVSWFGANLRELFNLQAYNLSIAVWVGFLALFGIAVDDGIVMATYLKQQFAEHQPRSQAAVRELVLAAAAKRIGPCLMTSATTILALLPVLSASGRGADLMIPMAVPTVGGMFFVLLSIFLIPVLYSAREEWRLALK
ncbi:efflux RND transporter permease subunit [Rheinheimera sp. UJ63]|uniref:efflux RND transporter permease subunit n=1 Tax=Rheinheimera sp. UJ63 TaxID=2910157 RepID=UPI001F3F57F8|nr:efflux RND transporter permease subunit [Rheinheimera sp. UJ63]MCF4010367.1 efflux RND transporter permease subunit [Rheinheimera sp. UJ63]